MSGEGSFPWGLTQQGLEDTVGWREKGVEQRENSMVEQPCLELPVLSCLRHLSHCNTG